MQDLINRLTRMAKHWKKWARRRNTNVYRIYDRDIPEYPFAIDIYGEHLVVSEYLNDSVMARKNYEEWRGEVLSVVRESLGFSEEFVHIRQRERQKEGQYEKSSHENVFVIVEESGLKFKVNVSSYLDTGLFADHRQTRSMIRDMVSGRRFLNLFCYTGSFTVYAAAGDARETVSVDTSAVYLDWLKENLQLNDLDDSQHEVVRDDARAFLAHYRGEKFDVIFIDPPVFSRGKKQERDFDVMRDHGELIDAALAHLAPGGTLFFSTNKRKFRLQWAPENSSLARAKSTFSVKDISLQTIPDDFRNKQIHVCYQIDKN